MSPTLPQIQPKGVPLKDAWFTFAPPSLQAACQTNSAIPKFEPSSSTLEKFQYMAESLGELRRLQDVRNKAVELLQQRLSAGELLATGLPPPTQNKFQRVPIEAAFWDVAKIDPVKGSAAAMGVHYSAVQVFPVQRVHQSEPAAEKPVESERSILSEPAMSDFPASAGATSYEYIRIEAILYCFNTYRNFEKIKLKRRLEMVVDYVETNHPDIDTAWGFDRSSFYTTVRKLRDAGRLPSNNVQQ